MSLNIGKNATNLEEKISANTEILLKVALNTINQSS
jgi:hypothetical protein